MKTQSNTRYDSMGVSACSAREHELSYILLVELLAFVIPGSYTKGTY